MNWFEKRMVLLIIPLLIGGGCKKNNTVAGNQDILFQYEYINYAWGYHHSGFYITGDGNIYTYNNPEEWNFPEKDSTMTRQQVIENLSRCQLSQVTISKEELQKYSRHIPNIAFSKVTAPKNVGADAGSVEFICYLFSEKTVRYKSYIIKKEGDFTCENLNFFAKKVALWMKDVHSLLPAK
jgi:hypothetical protein